jgi:hypothetical protein
MFRDMYPGFIPQAFSRGEPRVLATVCLAVMDEDIGDSIEWGHMSHKGSEQTSA